MYDIAVIGGGVVGHFLVRELLRSDRSVWHAVSDTTPPTSLAAGAMLSAGSEMRFAGTTAEEQREASHRLRGLRLFPEIVAELSEVDGAAIEYGQGTFVVAPASDDAEKIMQIEELCSAIGAEATRVNRADVPGYLPHRLSRGREALYLPEEAWVSSGALLSAMTADASSYTTYERHQGNVKDVQQHGNTSVVLSCESGEEVSAGEVVIAGGASTPALLEGMSLHDFIPRTFAGRGVGMKVAQVGRFEKVLRTPNRGFACGIHVVPLGDGCGYLGATNRLQLDRSYDRQPTLGEMQAVIADATTILSSAFAEAEVLSTQIGYRPFAVDYLPIVGRIEDRPILVATGTYRNGYTLAPLIAEQVLAILEERDVLAPEWAPSRSTQLACTMPEVNIDDMAQGLVEYMLEPDGRLPLDGERTLFLLLRSAIASWASEPHSDVGAVPLAKLLSSAPVKETGASALSLFARLAESQFSGGPR